MDAPGFPTGPSSTLPLIIVWLLLGIVLAAAVVTAVRVLRRPSSGTIWRLLPLVVVVGVVVPALVLWVPAHAHAGTDTVAGRGECPLSTISGAFMAGDPAGGMYAYWRPCVDASRLRLGLAVGGYALAAGLVGMASMSRTTPRRPHVERARQGVR